MIFMVFWPKIFADFSLNGVEFRIFNVNSLLHIKEGQDYLLRQGWYWSVEFLLSSRNPFWHIQLSQTDSNPPRFTFSSLPLLAVTMLGARYVFVTLQLMSLECFWHAISARSIYTMIFSKGGQLESSLHIPPPPE